MGDLNVICGLNGWDDPLGHVLSRGERANPEARASAIAKVRRTREAARRRGGRKVWVLCRSSWSVRRPRGWSYPIVMTINGALPCGVCKPGETDSETAIRVMYELGVQVKIYQGVMETDDCTECALVVIIDKNSKMPEGARWDERPKDRKEQGLAEKWCAFSGEWFPDDWPKEDKSRL